VASLAAGCGTQPTPAPTIAASATTPAAPTPSPALARADTLRIGFGHYFPFTDARHASVSLERGMVVPGSVIHAGLYRWDARFDVVPDLADGFCQPQGDGTVIRCRLVGTTFHDGTPLSADDVAYSYAIQQRQTFPFAGVTGKLVEVRIVDPRTIDFVLAAIDPRFFSEVLPGVPILSRHAVEASYAAFAAGTKDLQAKDLTKLADAIDDEIGRDPPVCSARVEEVAGLLERIGVRLYREDFSRGATATFDACAYLGTASGSIRQAGVAIGLTGLDAVAAAWQLLSIDWRPVGTGPYRLVSEDADGIHLEAWPGYHGGPAATRFLDFVPTNPDGSGVEDGTVDIFQRAYLGPAYQATASSQDVRIATPPALIFQGLAFNVRPGRLFADPALRRALQLCIDLPRDVDAATGGAAAPAYGPILRGSWADEPDLPRPTRDPAAARALIEGAGWQLGADGVYAKARRRLAADIVVRSNLPWRVKMADLVEKDARDCGMDIRGLPMSRGDQDAMLGHYPHAIPGTDQPFDILLLAWLNTVDPGSLEMFASSEVTDAAHPDGQNFTGFTDPVLDGMLAAAMATYDRAERARVYRQVQRELAAQLPLLFLWADNSYDVLRSAVATADGPLDLEVPNWAWQPERMVVAASGP
jgi:ABC-type transport system substrate-binding protein